VLPHPDRVEDGEFQLLVAPQVPCREAVPVSPRVAALGGVEREEVAALGGWWPPRPTCTLVTLRRPPANSLSFLPSSSSLQMIQPRIGLLPPPHLP